MVRGSLAGRSLTYLALEKALHEAQTGLKLDKYIRYWEYVDYRK